MAVVGIDAHKTTHTAMLVDELGRQIAVTTVRANTEGHLTLLNRARRHGVQRWAVEDCRHLSRGLERDLLAVGEVIVRVPPKLMAHARDAARTYGKSAPSTRWRSPVRRCDTRTCRQLASMDPAVTCDCWWTIARTSSASAPA